MVPFFHTNQRLWTFRSAENFSGHVGYYRDTLSYLPHFVVPNLLVGGHLAMWAAAVVRFMWLCQVATGYIDREIHTPVHAVFKRRRNCSLNSRSGAMSSDNARSLSGGEATCPFFVECDKQTLGTCVLGDAWYWGQQAATACACGVELSLSREAPFEVALVREVTQEYCLLWSNIMSLGFVLFFLYDYMYIHVCFM